MIHTFHLADFFTIADDFCGMIAVFEEMNRAVTECSPLSGAR